MPRKTRAPADKAYKAYKEAAARAEKTYQEAMTAEKAGKKGLK